MVVGVQTQHRRGTAAQWSASGKILAAGELGVTTDTKILKVGDGVNEWDDLPIAFEDLYLTIGGTATNSDLLGGISSDGFVKVADATTAATADKVAKRDGSGRLKATTGTSTDDVVNFDQMVAYRREQLVRVVSADATLALADLGGLVNISNANYTPNIVFTIPANATLAIPVGSWVDLAAVGKGHVAITPAGGVTLSGISLLYGGNSSVRLIKTSTDIWRAVAVNYSPGPILRRKIKAGADNTINPVDEFKKLRLDGADSGTALFTNNVDTLGANEQYNPAAELYRCYVRRSGYYEVSAQVSLNLAGNANGRMYAQLRVNNVLQHASAGHTRSSVKNSARISVRMPLNVNDFIEVYAKQDGASNDTICDDDVAASFLEWEWRRPL